MSSWFSKLFRKKTIEPVLEPESEELVLGREDFDFSDPFQRKRYVQGCLEQIAEAESAIERLTAEYDAVNGYLMDIEEIEAMPENDKDYVVAQAKKIIFLENDKARYDGRRNRMRDTDFRKMERLDDEKDEAVRKLKGAEEYQQAIRQDMQKLEGEKQACLYRKHEAKMAIANSRGMIMIIACAIVACIGVLLFLQLVLELDTKIGYLITIGCGALVLTIIYLKYIEAVKELKHAAASLNKVILLQNKVKIRYVNNTNLLDYFYMKFGVESGSQLDKLWKQYQEEKEEREKIREAEADLEFYCSELVKMLKKYRLFDPLIWTHQAAAIVDNKEMVEVRHGLILRRQKLRKQMEYNSQNAAVGQEEIKEMMSDYPQYAAEVLKIISDHASD